MKNSLDVAHRNIDQYKQNSVYLIARDFEEHFNIPQQEAFKILMARGVFKWFAVRRNLIKLKDSWKERVTLIIKIIKASKKLRDFRSLYYYRGYLKGYEDARKEVRALCHSSRWQASDKDEKSLLYMEERL